MNIITPIVKSEQAFKDVLLLAAQICGTKVAAVSFFDEHISLILENDEFNVSEFLNDNALKECFSKHPEILVIPNIELNQLFDSNKIINNGSPIQFYAGVPLIDQGVLLGHLSVMGQTKRTLSAEQTIGLEALGRQCLAEYNLQRRLSNPEKKEEYSKGIEGLMKTIFYNASDAVIVMDDKGVILQGNPKAEAMFGWTEKGVTGKSFRKTIICEQSYTDYFKLIDQYKIEGQAQPTNQTIEICAYKNDRTIFEISIGVSSATIQDKRFCIFSISDITDRKLIASKLDKQKEFYESILNKLPIDIAVFDADHRYLFVNPGAISKEEFRKFIIGKDDYEYAAYRNRDILTAHTRRQQFLQVKNTGKEIRWEDSLPDPKGVTITHLRRMYPVHDENDELTMVIGFGLDITDRKMMEEKQASLVKHLSEQNTQLIDFCNIVSHNLRAPLVNMSMLVDFIEQCEDPEEQKLFISKLSPVLSNLHTTFNELVESIQIKYDLDIQRENIDLSDSVQRTLNALETEITQLEANIEFDFSEVSSIFYPPKYLHSIIHNLISNSLKYNSPKRKLRIKMATRFEKGSVIFSITDNGLGIDLVKHKDNFFKIGKVFHRHPNAKGFGLFMTKTQVEAMGGKIWVESVPDEGSVFFIEFTNQTVCSQKSMSSL